MAKSQSWSAVFEMLIAAALWGFGFIATVWGLERVNAFEITLLRFVIAGLFGLPFLLTPAARKVALHHCKLSLIPAIWLVSTLIFQTLGLAYTTPTKSGFITTLYVVFVPILEAFITKRRLAGEIWLCVAVALFGTGLIVDIGFSELNYGDVLTFICALGATGQIYWLGGVSPQISRPFVFNIYQSMWAVLLAAPFVRFGDLGHKLQGISEWPTHTIFGILSLALGSTVIAFFLQVRGQAKVSPTVSSLIFLLESPFALLYAMLLLGQTLSARESMGAALIFVAAFFATWFDARAKKIDFGIEVLNP